MTEHITKAKEYGRKSVEEGWTSFQTMTMINTILHEYGTQYSADISKAFAVGINEYLKEKNDKYL